MINLILTAAIYSATACAPNTGVESYDATVATALAKGAVSQRLGSVISAKTTYTKSTSENGNAVDASDEITETIQVESNHQLGSVSIKQSGYKIVQGENQYCVELEINEF
ncbi:hypothetical protein GNS53_15975 [Vibrio cholerae]|uniref:hypothetical protein n=1 Tax=Vibrio cholerae TaxID=666 RepID=UPI000C7EEF21|nr:hypothetical protein [Vibrio cholerae]EGQ8650693.1 hypothetical protein [Vibrio cholerae]PKQ52107.1 hypothetical protein CR151_17100 [Vibrio cholerae]